MIQEFITSLFQIQVWGNSIIAYLVVLSYLLLTWPLSNFINYIINHYLREWTKYSKSKIDDVLIDSVNPSITQFVFALMFYIGSVNISNNITADLISRTFNLLVIVPAIYFFIKASTGLVGLYLKSKKEDNQKVNEAGIDLLISIIRISLGVVGVLLILSNLGYNVTAIITGLGIGGLAFALAAQDVLKNFFAGISLIFDKTFGKGERVVFETYSGRIEELRLRSTKLRTYDGTLLTIPNSKLAENIVENVTRVPKVKIKLDIGVEYGTSVKKLREAKKIILEAIKKNEHANEEACDIWFDNFGPYSLDIKVIYYAKKLTMDNWSERVSMREEVNFSIKEGFEKARISMAFPTQTIHTPDLVPIKSAKK